VPGSGGSGLTPDIDVWHHPRADIATDNAPEKQTAPRNGFDRYFEITARGSTLSREIRGGLATFFTMAYLVVLNPLILGGGAPTGAARTCRRPRSPRPPRWSPTPSRRR
jgi:hypothetical protein